MLVGKDIQASEAQGQSEILVPGGEEILDRNQGACRLVGVLGRFLNQELRNQVELLEDRGQLLASPVLGLVEDGQLAGAASAIFFLSRAIRSA